MAKCLPYIWGNQVELSDKVEAGCPINLNFRLTVHSFFSIFQIFHAATWMDLETIILSEISQQEKTNIWYHLCANSKENDTNEFIYKTETDPQT